MIKCMFCNKGVQKPIKSKYGVTEDNKPALVHKHCEERIGECCKGAKKALSKVGL